jgi:hypothetical protein
VLIVQHETKEVSNRIEVNPKGVTGLVLVLDGSNRQNVGLALIEVVDEEVEMQLLGNWTLGPCGRDEGTDLLETERGPAVVEQGNPGHVSGIEVAEWFDF